MTAKVFDMILAVPKYGRVKANKILGQCRISPSKTIGGLSQRQRAELVTDAPQVALRPWGACVRPAGFDWRTWLRASSSSRARRGSARALSSATCASGCPGSSSPSRRRPASLVRAKRTRVDYHFLSADEFAERADAGDFLEHATFSGNRYGTLRSEIERTLDAGLVGGPGDRGPGRPAGPGRDGRRGRPDLHRAARSRRSLRERLSGRGTDSAEAIERRLETAKQELEASQEFKHVVVNDDLERAADELEAIVRRRVGRLGDSARPGYPERAMVKPRVENLLERTDSHYAAVLVAAKRARQLNSYYRALGEGSYEEYTPPMVETQLGQLPDDRSRRARSGQDQLRVQGLGRPASRGLAPSLVCGPAWRNRRHRRVPGPGARAPRHQAGPRGPRRDDRGRDALRRSGVVRGNRRRSSPHLRVGPRPDARRLARRGRCRSTTRSATWRWRRAATPSSSHPPRPTRSRSSPPASPTRC